MKAALADQYGPIVAEILAELPRSPLDRGAIAGDRCSQLAAVSNADLFIGHAIASAAMADACRSGLLLRLNDLDAAHELSQQIHSPTGSLWHAIMHRREGDFSNSKYWLRRVGQHEVFRELADSASAIDPASSSWDAFAFVDFVENIERGADDRRSLAEKIQHREWSLLFDYCWQKAVGK
jgi:hypothetical protein